MWKRLGCRQQVRALCVSAIALLPYLPASAQSISCEGVGLVTVSPRHPSPTDTVNFGVTLPKDPLGPAKPFKVWLAHSVTLAQNLDYNINIEVYLADESISYPGAPAASPYPYTPMMGAIAPLAVGRYTPRAVVTVYNPVRRMFEEVCPLINSPTFSVAAQPGPTTSAPVVEFYNSNLDHYFITQVTTEIALLDAGTAWKRTGQSFLMYTPLGSDGRGQPVIRYYGLPAFGLDSHFFTWNLLERSALDAGVAHGWVKETEDAFEAVVPDVTAGQCPPGTLPVYRLWNGRTDSAHRYSTSMAIRDAMIAQGYVVEGFGDGVNAVAMCAPSQ